MRKEDRLMPFDTKEFELVGGRDAGVVSRGVVVMELGPSEDVKVDGLKSWLL